MLTERGVEFFFDAHESELESVIFLNLLLSLVAWRNHDVHIIYFIFVAFVGRRRLYKRT